MCVIIVIDTDLLMVIYDMLIAVYKAYCMCIIYYREESYSIRERYDRVYVYYEEYCVCHHNNRHRLMVVRNILQCGR